MGNIIAFGGENVLVDDNIIEEINKYKWHVNDGYVRGYVNGKVVKLHRFIMKPNKKELIDHINHNPLDNRRSNLRVCTHTQNMANRLVNKTSRSGLKGVCYDKSMSRRKRWAAYISHKGKIIKIGRYFTKEDAAAAHDRVALELRGNFAKLNMEERLAS